MKIAHNPHGSWERPSAVVDDAYEAEVQRSTQRGERLWRRAQKRFDQAQARLQSARSSAKPAKSAYLAELAALVEIRRAELEEVRQLMTGIPASAQHRGTGSYRPVPIEHASLL